MPLTSTDELSSVICLSDEEIHLIGATRPEGQDLAAYLSNAADMDAQAALMMRFGEDWAAVWLVGSSEIEEHPDRLVDDLGRGLRRFRRRYRIFWDPARVRDGLCSCEWARVESITSAGSRRVMTALAPGCQVHDRVHAACELQSAAEELRQAGGPEGRDGDAERGSGSAGEPGRREAAGRELEQDERCGGGAAGIDHGEAPR